MYSEVETLASCSAMATTPYNNDIGIATAFSCISFLPTNRFIMQMFGLSSVSLRPVAQRCQRKSRMPRASLTASNLGGCFSL